MAVAQHFTDGYRGITVEPLSDEKVTCIKNSDSSLTLEIEGSPYMLLLEWTSPGCLLAVISKLDREGGPLVDFIEELNID